MQNKYILFIGMNNNPYSMEQTKQLIVDTLSDCTISYCEGFYHNEIEPTIKVEKYTDKSINKAIEFLAKQLKQECILVEKYLVDSFMIYSEKQQRA